MGSNNKVPVAALIAAAGQSSRMGFPKALLPLQGSTFIEVITKALLDGGVKNIAVTLPDDLKVPTSLTETLKPYRNIFAHREMLGSVQSVLSDRAFKAQGLIICPVDMPFMTSQLIERFLKAAQARGDEKTLFFSMHRGQTAHPLMITHHFFPEILDLSDEDSLRTMVSRYPRHMVAVESDDPRVLLNINTPQDFAGCTNPSANIFEAAATDAPGVKFV